jgi:uncharacterized membrane protein
MTPHIPMAPRPSAAVRANQGLLWMTKHWLIIFILASGTYAAMPFSAPIFMHIGLTDLGRFMYSINSVLCHQYSFRTWFLFGEQSAYPRQMANAAGLKSFETYSVQIIGGDSLYAAQNPPPNLNEWNPDTLTIARDYIGDAQMGYKVAQCERDNAIYLAIVVGSVIFSIPRVRRNLRTVPLPLYVLVGVLPIALDGFAQVLSEPPFNLFPMYESSPLFRTITGALFGLMNIWLALPYLQISMRQTEVEIAAKLSAWRARQVAPAAA